jgi:hypothetical protein
LTLLKNLRYSLLLLIFPTFLFAQKDSIQKKLSFSGDFRFRIEQDWNSRKADGTYRDDRTRLRYRARFGLTYDYKEWVSFGARIRTGDPKKQQDPQLTLGDGNKEFNTLPIGFEKIYAAFKYDWFSGWMGKNDFPFEKQNELFWSDNVFPEGLAISGKLDVNGELLETLEITTGHFIIAANGTSLSNDSYFEGFQIASSHWNKRIKIFPSFYFFHKMPDIPDGNENYYFDYSILHIGTSAEIIKKPAVSIGIDYYQNLENYSKNDSIPLSLREQKEGIVVGAGIGNLKEKGDWNAVVTYTYLQRYAAVDFLSQNDWARWDYSSQGSADGRLTNFKGFEFMAGYKLGKSMDLKIRYFMIDQIVPYGPSKETNSRVRLDFNIGF